MKLRQPISILLAILSLSILGACNSSDDNEYDDVELRPYTNVSVKSFSLGQNDSVLAYLDTVFFSVDLQKARIFNADSLPKGTSIDSLTVEIGLPTVSRAMLYFNSKEGVDSIDYLENSTDTVNFANGPVRLSLTAADGVTSRDYLISVNVHKQDPDSMMWGNTAMRELPTSLGTVRATKAVELDGTYYCLTTNGTQACIATATNIQGDWTTRTVSLPAGADTQSFAAAGSNLYILASGHLYASADGGASWRATGKEMTHIYGAFGDNLLGCLRRASGDYVSVSYPRAASKEYILPEDCPVSGTGNMVLFSTDWATEPMCIITGGADASGKITGASWAYDGEQWACISLEAGEPRTGMSVVPYIGYRYQFYFDPRSYNVLLAFGGRKSDGSIDNTMWISFDRGLHWTKGSQSIQPSGNFPALFGASAIIASQAMSAPSSRSINLWKEYPSAVMPSRASVDYTWECPYIYVIGGVCGDGSISDAIWRGAVNRLTYRPLF